ncbi:MCP four helix bundle domain-containing protein [Larkinella bovis]|uniref:MCP four helix bundle domain-containing protein n=1 Tax=Larkinella bovis TaxID=683041 RepID=A0ABW0I9L9_9BACT
MKWSFVIQQKIKAAVLLTGIMLLVVLCTLISRSTIKDIDKSFSSIYQDRLIPAVDMVYLSENLYTKRLLVENYLFAAADIQPAQIQSQLTKQNQAIDSLIRKFEKTVLTVDEAKNLRDFKNRVDAYAQIEREILQLSQVGNQPAGSELFNGLGSTTFLQSIKSLNELIKIQSAEGQVLVNESMSESSQFTMISTLQIAVAIIIGLLILGLIHNSKIINQERQPFHLN